MRTSSTRRIAALVALLALALNLAVLPLAQAHAPAVDAFGQPICSEHPNATPDRPGAPSADLACPLCCTLSVAASAGAPVLPLPVAIAWTQAPILALALRLPSPSRHFLGPPRGPPTA